MNAATQAPRRRWLLIVSLCLNLFLVGVILAGLFIAWQREALGGYSYASSPFHPRNIAAMLPPEGKAKVDAIIADNRARFVPIIRAQRQARLQAFRLLQNEPLDVPALTTTMTAARTADDHLATEGQSLLLEILKKLTPEERAIIVQKIRSRTWTREAEKPAVE